MGVTAKQARVHSLEGQDREEFERTNATAMYAVES